MGKKKSIQQVFWDKVGKGENPDNCWLWTGCTNPGGYGQLGTTIDHSNSGSTTAQRFSFQLLVGPIPALYEIDHLCNVPSCVNPRHLEAVTFEENMRRRKDRRSTHCKHGHEWTAENIYHVKRGYRKCKPCTIGRAASQYSRMKNAKS